MAKGHDNKWDADKVAVVASSFYYICVSSTSFPYVDFLACGIFFSSNTPPPHSPPPQRSRRRKNTFQLIAHWIFIYKRGWSPVIVTDERFYVSTFAPWTSLDRWHLDIFHFKTLENIDMVNIGRQERDCETLTGILLRNSRTKIISTAFSYTKIIRCNFYCSWCCVIYPAVARCWINDGITHHIESYLSSSALCGANRHFRLAR